MIYFEVFFFLREKSSKVHLDLTIVRGQGRAPEVTATESARFDELENRYFVGHTAQPTGLQ